MEYTLLLNGYNLFNYLRNKKKVDGENFWHDVTVESFKVEEGNFLKTRNRTFVVSGINGNKGLYFVKQCPIHDPFFRFTFHTEKLFYDTFENSSLPFHIPTRLFFSERDLVSVFSFDKNSQDAETFFKKTLDLNSLNKPLRVELFSNKLAIVLKEWHEKFLGKTDESIKPFDNNMPFILTLDKMMVKSQEGRFQESGREFYALLKGNPTILEKIEQLRNGWFNRPCTLLHGDLKPSNVLIQLTDGKEEIEKITLLDWEMASVGDPLWDVASMQTHWHLEVLDRTFPGLLAEECEACLQYFLRVYFDGQLNDTEKALINAYTGVQLIQFLWINPSQDKRTIRDAIINLLITL